MRRLPRQRRPESKAVETRRDFGADGRGRGNARQFRQGNACWRQGVADALFKVRAGAVELRGARLRGAGRSGMPGCRSCSSVSTCGRRSSTRSNRVLPDATGARIAGTGPVSTASAAACAICAKTSRPGRCRGGAPRPRMTAPCSRERRNEGRGERPREPLQGHRRGGGVYKFGNRVRYARTDVDAWAAERRFSSTTDAGGLARETA